MAEWRNEGREEGNNAGMHADRKDRRTEGRKARRNAEGMHAERKVERTKAKAKSAIELVTQAQQHSQRSEDEGTWPMVEKSHTTNGRLRGQ